uniref:Uncharacterized protein n=1 Tax=Mus musculus TaxID=10090 RepID=Q8C813_MOUSE|nr:unnamed protein product [Mus musculus]
MLSLSLEWRAQGRESSRGSQPSARSARRSPGWSTGDQGGPKQRRTSRGPGKPRPRREPLRVAGCRVSRFLPRGPERAALRATSQPVRPTARPPARPGCARLPGKRSHLAQKGAAAGRRGVGDRCLPELCGHRTAAPQLRAPGAGGGRGGGGESGHRPAVPPPCRLPAAPAPG